MSPGQSWADAFSALPAQQPSGDVLALGAIVPRHLIELRQTLDRRAAYRSRVFAAATSPTPRLARQTARATRPSNTVVYLPDGVASLRYDDPSARHSIDQLNLCAVYGDVGAPELRGIEWAADRFTPYALLYLSAGVNRHALARLELDIFGERDTKIVDERRPPTSGGTLFVLQRYFSRHGDDL